LIIPNPSMARKTSTSSVDSLTTQVTDAKKKPARNAIIKNHY